MSNVIALNMSRPPVVGLVRFYIKFAIRALALLLTLNVAFLALRLADNLIDKRAVAATLRWGYVDGSMVASNYSNNQLVGIDQYSDCVTAQLAALGGESPIQDALAPRLLSGEQVAADTTTASRQRCLELRTYLEGQFPDTPRATYTRFWHGGAGILAASLRVLPVDGYRALLLNLTLALIALTGVLAARARSGLLLAIGPLLCFSFLFNGQFGYGQLFSYGPAQVALWSMAALTVALRDKLTERNLLHLAIVSGALEAFLDQLISPPMVAITFLTVALFTWRHRAGQQSLRRMGMMVAGLYACWGFGFAGTYLVKLALSVALIGPSAFNDMFAQLAFRVGTVDPQFSLYRGSATRWEVMGRNMVALLSFVGRLGYSGSNTTLSTVLVIACSALSGWILALYGLLRNRGRLSYFKAGIPYLVASAFMLLWIFVLPEHTLRHAFFMVRSAAIWILAGWGWLCAARAFSSDFASQRHASDEARDYEIAEELGGSDHDLRRQHNPYA